MSNLLLQCKWAYIGDKHICDTTLAQTKGRHILGNYGTHIHTCVSTFIFCLPFFLISGTKFHISIAFPQAPS